MRGPGGSSRAAFTLVEALVVVGVIVVLVGVLLPALASARNAARDAVCGSNLRQVYTLCRTYADEHDGRSPAIGVPWGAPPNWALVVQQRAGRAGSTPGSLYTTASVLVCPSARAMVHSELTRAYAINATGHAGAVRTTAGGVVARDPDNFDVEPAFIRLDLVGAPSLVPLFVDSAASASGPGQPPPTRTASVIDFGDAAHVSERLGRWHGGRRVFNAAMADGSGRGWSEAQASWATPLP